MSAHYEQVKKYYDDGLWSADRVLRAVVKGWITEEEKAEIMSEVVE